LAWQDREYSRYGSSSRNPLMWLLTGSVPLFTVFGIRVRAHASLLVFIGLELLLSGVGGGLGMKNAVVSMTILFGSILLHEFGHCFAARAVGGSGDDILMWPLGGLAAADPPRRWWPSFITTAAGPGVNLAICIVTGAAIAILSRTADAIPWFPFKYGLNSYIPSDWTTYYIFWVFLVNWALFVFNMLLVFYPFDGGRMVQEILWAFIGYYKSMRIAVVIGMVAAVIVGMLAIATWSIFLFLIAVIGFRACMQQRRMLLEVGPYEFDEPAYGASLAPSYSERRSNRRAQKQNQRRANEQRAEREKIDKILAKVSAHGMHSLTWWEKRTLRKGSERMR
jgi:stage IV sporulation protein FB